MKTSEKLTSHPDCARCARVKAGQREWAAKRYKGRRAAGKCVVCGKPSGKTARCSQHNNTHIDREWLKRHPDAEVMP